MDDNFSLVNANWIPVIQLGNPLRRRVGLREALLNAHELHSVNAATPLETAATYRLLLAVLQAALDITEDNWTATWKNKAFAASEIEEYLNHWQHRFNLFDNARPFYQDAKLTTKQESVSSLSGHVASGADATLFNHNTQGKLVLSAADAALALLSIQAFGLGGTKGGGKSFTDAPCARGMVILVEGESLFETLMLNLFSQELPRHRLRKVASDRPAWEMDDPFLEDVRRPYGLLDHLTWHNRRVKLTRDVHQLEGLYVKDMQYDLGLRTTDAANQTVRDVFNPMYYWRANTSQKAKGDRDIPSHSPLRFQAEKALWRDSSILFDVRPGTTDAADKAPAAVEQVQQLALDGRLGWAQTFKLQAFGACTEPGQDKTFFYRHETLPLPLSILQPGERDLIGQLSRALHYAEKAKEALTAATSKLALLFLKPLSLESGAETSPSKEAREQAEKLADSWGVERYFWADLEPFFHRMIQDLPAKQEIAIDTWRAEVRRSAEQAFRQAESYMAGDLRSLRAAALSHQQFDMALAAAVGRNGSQKPEQEVDEQ